MVIIVAKTFYFTSDKPHYPYELPKGWVWTTLPELCVLPITDGTHQTPTYTDKANGIPFLSSKDVTSQKIDWTNIKYITKDLHEILYKRIAPQKNDILLAKNGTTGVAAIVEDERVFDIYVTLAVIRPSNFIDPKFLLYIINSDFCKKQFNDHLTGIGLPNLHLTDIKKTIIPVPPYKEQVKIVDAINRLFKWIYVVDKGRLNTNELISQTKAKILDLAIHGKLVPQDPTDEPAAELLKRINPKAEITCDNGHYQKLPEGWAVCCLENVAKVLDNLRKPINSNERNSRIANKHESELFPYYGATGQVGFIDDYLVDGKFLLLGEDGAPFLDKYAIKSYPIKGKFWVNNHAHILKPLCDFDYLMYYLNHIDYKDYVNGSTRLKLTQSDMRSIKILLPPLTEQKRISVKVKYLFCLLDTIACNL